MSFDAPTMQAVADKVQSGKFLQLDGTGHFGALEKPAEFARIITEALTINVSPPQ